MIDTDPAQSRDFTMKVFNNPPPQESEDCLYLNVFAPATSNNNGNKSVMVWIYGGGLQFGTAMLPAYDGSSFAANQDVVLVAPNYRTNVFGFPGNLTGMTGASNMPSSNLGFLDQVSVYL